MRGMVVSALAAAAWVAVGCGPGIVPVDPRAAQIERVPATAALVVQAYMPAVADIEALRRWLDRVGRSSDALPDASCLTDLAAAATAVTSVGMLDESGRFRDGAMMVAGAVTSEGVAACFRRILQRFDSAPSRPSGGPGRYTVGEGGSAMVVVDLPGGAGVAIGTPIGIDAVLAPPAEGGGAAPPLMTRLRGLTGGGDLEIYLLQHAAREVPIDAAALALRRGAVDRYEAVLLTPSPDDAQMASFAAMGALAMAGGAEGILAEEAANIPEGDARGDVLREILPTVSALARALGEADIEVDGAALRVVVELDPSSVGPTDVAALTGMWLLLGRIAASPDEMPGQEIGGLPDLETSTSSPPDDYTAPGLEMGGSPNIDLPPDK